MTAAAPQIEDVLALTPLQEGLFALHQLAEDGVDLYSMQFVVDIDGPVDLELLRRSAQAMLDRHPNLRAAFWDRDVPKPVQIVPVHAALPWSERVATPAEFDSIARSERRRPFDLSRGPALRVVVLSVPGETKRRMIFTAHHILVDGWSLAVFFTELLAVYRAGERPTRFRPRAPTATTSSGSPNRTGQPRSPAGWTICAGCPNRSWWLMRPRRGRASRGKRNCCCRRPTLRACDSGRGAMASR
ncbi:condensation domain protein [Mycobacterium ulcerans str. Harvey]|uniref:Condensation domain protein n=1 Tax=Mycobacterium ulcerans str. Harvey TaxID=1299332 RepID=A0ABP3A8L4_MYCUL|nr:condensation domain protein [Mycobacterium ulcerans str. Harvey]